MSEPSHREDFARYKRDVKKEGKSFFPYAVFHDAVMSLVVVGVIIGLAALWFFTSGEGSGRRRRAWTALSDRGGPRLDAVRATPGLVLLLPLLPTPHLQVARVGHSRHDRDPDHCPHLADGRAVHRPASRATAAASPGGHGCFGAGNRFTRNSHVQGRHRQGRQRGR